MTRRLVVLAVLGAVVLAGCMGGPGAEPETADPTENGSSDASSAAIPGVTNGSLSNATALAAANDDVLASEGGAVRVDWDTPATNATFEVVAGEGFETYTLSGSPGGASGTATVDIWSNETSRVIRSTTDGQESFQLVGRHNDRPNAIRDVEDYLAAGNFTVTNETGPNGTVVLSAEKYVPAADDHDPIENPTSFSARLVVDESGLIHTLTVDATVAEGPHWYDYAVTRTGIETVSAPAWTDDLPSAATLDAQLSVDVENSSHLTIQHDGGDAVPADAVVSVSDNQTSGQATLETPLADGETRYVYFEESTGDLTIAAERPSEDDLAPLESPASLSIETEDGVNLHSVGMGWGSASASEPDAGGSSGESAEASESTGSTSGSGGTTATADS